MCSLLHAEEPTTLEDTEVGRALYDQRQTGKYNIHVSIKDVAIIEVDQNELADETYNEADDDYYYDDSALTIKPIKFSTEASTTTTTTSTELPATTTTAAATTVAIPTPSSNMSSYSAKLLADIAAAAAAQRSRPKANNLIIMSNTPNASTPAAAPSGIAKWLQARSKDEPITSSSTSTTAAPLAALLDYTPAQGHDSPIFKFKVQRGGHSAEAAATRCRSHQYRDAQGKCRAKRSGSVLRKLFGMLVSLPFAGNRRGLGHGLQISPQAEG
ncbi:CG15905 [Drosophila busckii]|uniref:CG15905 n=2 Tax=Drosophila busckii TaxID=30019 RepID=A0A0M4EVB0_DROBS|nr:CG15905 [Drosophila busckii]